MAYVIGAPCVDVMDRSCVEQCPVDCIYEGSRKLYIHPGECIDCGACEAVCPVEAISQASRLAPAQDSWLRDNEAFFTTVLPGRTEPIGSPGGAAALGPIGADTATVTSLDPQ